MGKSTVHISVRKTKVPDHSISPSLSLSYIECPSKKFLGRYEGRFYESDLSHKSELNKNGMTANILLFFKRILLFTSVCMNINVYVQIQIQTSKS